MVGQWCTSHFQRGWDHLFFMYFGVFLGMWIFYQKRGVVRGGRAIRSSLAAFGRLPLRMLGIQMFGGRDGRQSEHEFIFAQGTAQKSL